MAAIGHELVWSSLDVLTVFVAWIVALAVAGGDSAEYGDTGDASAAAAQRSEDVDCLHRLVRDLPDLFDALVRAVRSDPEPERSA